LIAAGRGRPRTYRVASVVSLRPLPESFTRPGGFDLAAFWQKHVDEYERAEIPETAVVRLSPTGVTSLRDVLGPKAARLARQTLGPADETGWQRATIPLESVPHAASTLLRLGAEVQVLAPEALVTHMTETIRAMTGLYPPAGY
jgi:predicted DNA-binding transcriptional regulator YafY